MVIVSEFTRCVHSLLDVDILAGKLLYFTFDSVLHEMLRLVPMRQLLTLIHSWKSISATVLIRE